jgi:hypothetical protein
MGALRVELSLSHGLCQSALQFALANLAALVLMALVYARMRKDLR